MTKVIFSKVFNKQNQVKPFLEKLMQREDTDLNYLLLQGFLDLEETPDHMFPLGQPDTYMVNRIRNEKEIEIELAKRLSPQIYEMKADHKQEYHRFIYFPYEYKEENCYIFVFGFTKTKDKTDHLTNHYLKTAKNFYDFLKRTGNEEMYFEE